MFYYMLIWKGFSHVRKHVIRNCRSNSFVCSKERREDVPLWLFWNPLTRTDLFECITLADIMKVLFFLSGSFRWFETNCSAVTFVTCCVSNKNIFLASGRKEVMKNIILSYFMRAWGIKLWLFPPLHTYERVNWCCFESLHLAWKAQIMELAFEERTL